MIYFEFLGKKMKMSVQANSKQEAREKIKSKLIFYQAKSEINSEPKSENEKPKKRSHTERIADLIEKRLSEVEKIFYKF